MKREANLLLNKAVDSLTLAVEHFNRADDRGRTSSVLILLDHAFEMLLKAAILHRKGKIRERRAKETIGFDACVRRALSDGKIKFLSADQAITFQTINGLRDAAQHHLIDITEQQLYIHAQSGMTLFRDIVKSVFSTDLSTRLPARVLPLSTLAPLDLATLFESETTEIKKLLGPRKRRRTQAYARLRPLAILDATIRGEKGQPSVRELRKKGTELLKGQGWENVFPGAASIEFVSDGTGHKISLRITKKEGIPVQLVPEGTPGASVIGTRRVNELDFYNLGRNQLAEGVKLSQNMTTAAIWHLNLQKDADCFKEIIIGKSKFKRYSQRAIERIKREIAQNQLDTIWESYKRQRFGSKSKSKALAS